MAIDEITGGNRPYFNNNQYLEEELTKVRLKDFFEAARPDDLTGPNANNRYSVRVDLSKLPSNDGSDWHHSLQINADGSWTLWSAGVSGKSALDFLLGVENAKFFDACRQIFKIFNNSYEELVAFNEEVAKNAPAEATIEESAPRALVIPKRHYQSNEMVKNYLGFRKISPRVIDFCLAKDLIYGCTRIQKNYETGTSISFPTVGFKGYDWSGELKYIGFRSCEFGIDEATGEDKDIHESGDFPGSNKEFSFRLENPIRNSIHFFEAAIDALSYATYLEKIGYEFCFETLVSVAGITTSKSKPIPKAVRSMLDHYANIKTVYLHFDNDSKGRIATENCKAALEAQGYIVIDQPAPAGKDWNEYINIIEAPRVKELEKDGGEAR